MKTANFGYLWRMDGVRGGAPCLDETGLSAEVLAGRFAAGDSIAELADEYGYKVARIEAAIRLVLFARGINLDEKRAARKVDLVIPLQQRRGNL